jgi:hypothetical protein
MVREKLEHWPPGHMQRLLVNVIPCCQNLPTLSKIGTARHARDIAKKKNRASMPSTKGF